MPKATRPVAIDGIEFDALISSDESYTADVPAYPTDKGFETSDTIILHPESLEMILFLSNTPVTWASRFGHNPMRAADVKARLLKAYRKRNPVTVVTSDETFEGMGITSITFSKSVDVGYAYQIPISLQKINTTQLKTVDIPASYGKSGNTGTNAGNASTTAGGSGGGSILYNLFGGESK